MKGASIYCIILMSQRETVEEASNDAVCPPQSENQPSSSFKVKSI